MNSTPVSSFSYRKTFVVGFGFLGISIIWPIFNQFIPIFLQAGNPDFERQLLAEGRAIPQVLGFALAPALALFIMTWDNLINVFVQPWVGDQSDRTWNRFGRRKGWIVLGVPIAVVGFVAIPFAPTAVTLALAILLTNIGMALFRSPTVAWLGDLYSPEERSKANGIINLMGGIGSIIALIGGGIVFDRFGRSAPFLAGAVLLVVAMATAVWGVTEPQTLAHAPEEKETLPTFTRLRQLIQNGDQSSNWLLLSILFWFIAFNALEAGLSSFAVFTLGLTPGAASQYAGAMGLSFLLFAIPAGLLGTKFGQRRVIHIGLSGLVVVFFVGYFLIQNTAVFLVVLTLAGFFWSLVNVNSLPLVYTYGHESQIGALTGLYYFSSQLAAVAGPTLGGLVVDVLHDQYRWLFLFGAFFMALAWLTMRRVQAPPTHTP